MSAYANPAAGLRPVRLVASPPASEHLQLFDLIIDQIAERVADKIASQLRPTESPAADQWLDSNDAANYLGISRHSVRRLAAEGSLPTEQAGTNCKLYFRRSDLDSWRCRPAARPSRLRSVS
jgi:excisionase family DNA binding protein